jgi:predicted phage terminase large subunit-like protein
MFRVVDRSKGVIGITGFRGLGKSAIFGFIYPIWKIINGERYVICCSANIEQSAEKTDFIRYELKNNKRLLHDFPELDIQDSDDNIFFLKNNAKIRAVSIKQTIRGTINSRVSRRPGLIVCDDIDEETNIGNIDIGKRKKEKILHEIKGSLDPQVSGKVLWLGNLTHPNFAICQLKEQIVAEMRSGEPSVSGDAPCIVGDEKRLLQIPLERKGRSLWEAQYRSSSLVSLQKELGMVGYLREMMGRSLIDGSIFKAHWFIRDSIPGDSQMHEVWLYFDPAWGTKGCYRAVIAIGYDGHRYYVLKVWCRQCENARMFEYLHQVYSELKQRFGVRVRFSYEANYGQSRIMADFDRWCDDVGLHKIGHYFKAIYNYENKNLRIEALEPVIESGKIIFPDGQDMQTLIAQFTSYPHGYIDGPDAVSGCMERFGAFGTANKVRVRGL